MSLMEYLDQKRFLTPPAGEPWPVEGMSDEERKDPLGTVERRTAARGAPPLVGILI